MRRSRVRVTSPPEFINVVYFTWKCRRWTSSELKRWLDCEKTLSSHNFTSAICILDPQSSGETPSDSFEAPAQAFLQGPGGVGQCRLNPASCKPSPALFTSYRELLWLIPSWHSCTSTPQVHTNLAFPFALGCGARHYGELTEQGAHCAAWAPEAGQKLSAICTDASCVGEVAKEGWWWPSVELSVLVFLWLQF